MSSKDKSRRPSGANASRRNRTTQPPSSAAARADARRANRRSTAQAEPSGIGARLSAVNPIVLWTSVAAVAGVVVIVAALVLTSLGSGGSSGDFNRPTVVTPSNIPESGQTLGSASAPVKLDLYSDFRCTGCGSFYRTTEPQLVSDFVATGKVRIVYHDFTLIDKMAAAQGVRTSASRDAANAGLCAADQGKFWTYHDWLFANQSPSEDPAAFSKDRLIGIAKAAGIDNATFEACVQNGTHDSDVAAEMSAAPSGLDATPTLYVNGKVVVSSKGSNYLPTYDDIKTAINTAAAASSGS